MKLCRKITWTAALLLSAAVFTAPLTGCSKNKSENTEVAEDAIKIQVKSADTTKPAKRRSKWNNANGVIAVVLGYGFNDETFINETYSKITDVYGEDKDGGLLYTMVFPDDFTYGSKARISDLYSKLNDKKIRGILLLGAPEDTNKPLARLQDEWDESVPYPIFSFFPQDEVLPTEATCDFVLEYEHVAEEDLDEEETQSMTEKSLPKILINAIRYMSELPGPLPADSELINHVQQIVGKDKTLRAYVDSETGIPSIKHFVIERPQTTGSTAKSTSTK